MGSDSSSTGTNSISSFGVTFVVNFIVLAVSVTGFLILRPLQKRIYQPRLNVSTIPSDQRPRALHTGIFAWFKDLVTRREAEILQDAGLDGYFFLRYLRLMFIISVVGIITLFPVLLPINATSNGGQTGFNKLSFTNVVNNKDRYYAHVFMEWLFFGFIIFTLYREMVYYVSVRQAVLTSPAYSTLVSSRTILISTVPKEFLSVEELTRIFTGVKHVWINRSQSELMDKVDERKKLAMKVEGAETKLLKTAVKNRLKSKTPIEGTDIDLYVPSKKRPSHKLKFLIGKKVDTIKYGREKIQDLSEEIVELKAKVHEARKLNSVFICFHTQEQAEVAVQVLAHHQALHMAPRHIGLAPADIVWTNMRLFWWERLVRYYASVAAITALVIFWSIPVAFVGSISNIEALTEELPWLDFLNSLPSWISGVVSGLLPTILLAILMAFLPIILRLMGKISGSPSIHGIELYVQNAYFAFQVIQVFLVTTIASGAAAVIQDIIKSPSSAMSLLATNLPKSSNFYISYFLLQGFSIAGGALLQTTALILFHVLSTLLDGTARKKWNRWNLLKNTKWGTVFPIYTNLGVIAITYSIISPLILCFSGLAFGLVYLAYLHNLLFVVSPSEGRGIYYPRAIFQTFTGLYLGEVCMLGLFVVAKSWGPVVLQAIILFVTIFVHNTLSSAFAPLLISLPRNLLVAETSTDVTESTGLMYENEQGIVMKEIKEQSLQTDNMYNRNDSISSGAVEPVIPTTSESNLEAGHGGLSKHLHVPTPIRHMSWATQYFQPHLYLEPGVVQHNFLSSRFHEPAAPLPADVEAGAYSNPAETVDDPVIWIPSDPWGLSDPEISALRDSGINAVSKGAWIEVNQEKKKFAIKTDTEVPIWTAPYVF